MIVCMSVCIHECVYALGHVYTSVSVYLCICIQVHMCMCVSRAHEWPLVLRSVFPFYACLWSILVLSGLKLQAAYLYVDKLVQEFICF